MRKPAVFSLLLLPAMLGGAAVAAEPVTLDVKPFKEGSGVASNEIYEVTLEKLKGYSTVALLTEEDDKGDAQYTATVSLAKGPGGFVGNLRVRDERAGEAKGMYVVLSAEEDKSAAHSIASSIARQIQAYEASRAEAEAAKKAAEEAAKKAEEAAAAEAADAPE